MSGNAIRWSGMSMAFSCIAVMWMMGMAIDSIWLMIEGNVFNRTSQFGKSWVLLTRDMHEVTHEFVQKVLYILKEHT